MSYKNICDTKIENKCPKCQTTPPDTNHLFNCPRNPTTLEPIDLWTQPAEVSIFLKLDEEECTQPENQT